MSETNEHKLQGEILEEFEFEGRPASIVRLSGEDADTFADDLYEHGYNLAENQEAPVARNLVHGIGLKFHRVVGDLVKKDRSALTRRIEYFAEGRKLHFQQMIKEGRDWKGNETEFVGLYLDGKIVSIVGVRKREQMSDGRQLYELTSASTAKGYTQKGFSKKLKKTLFEETMSKDPDAVWMGDSKNPNVIASWERAGWTVADIDDPREFAEIFRKRNAENIGEYVQGVHKLGYVDPRSIDL